MHSIEAKDAQFALAAHRFLMRLPHSAISAFLWIIVYLYFFESTQSVETSLIRTVLLYALSQTITMLCAPLALRLIRGNMLRGMVFGTLISAAALTYASALASGIFPHGAAAVGILLGLYRAFYRAPYLLEHREVAPEQRSFLTIELVLASAPLFAGLAVGSMFFYPHLLIAAAVIHMLALVPLLYVPHVYEDYSWSYRRAFKELLDAKNHSLLSHSFFMGVAGGVLFLIWPLLLYFLFAPSPLALGAAFSGTLFLILAFRFSRARVVIDQHADDATYIDEYTVLKEMALAGGRLAVALAAVALVAMTL